MNLSRFPFVAVMAVLTLLCCPAFADLGQPLDIKTELELAYLRYFIDNTHPETGLVRDKANSFDVETNNVSSMAATGFGVAVLANAATRGLVDRDFALDRFTKAMRFSRDHVEREHGWFVHFANWETGLAAWDAYNDFSNIDTALFIAGALYAAAIFPNTEAAEIAHQLYSDLDFLWFMTDANTKPESRTLSIGYDRRTGFMYHRWSEYAEQMILVILGLGHPTAPLPVEAWYAFDRHVDYSGEFAFPGMNKPLFVHQYSHVYIDFRNWRDTYQNYFQTSVSATKFNRKVCRERQGITHQMARLFWGQSAGEGPSDKPNSDALYFAFNPMVPDETFCIACTVGSTMFLPNEVLEDAKAWRTSPLASLIWGRYGFTDSVNLKKNFFSKRSFGITVGAGYLSLANMNDSTSIWRVFNQIPEIKKAMDKIPSRSIDGIATVQGSL